MRAGLMLLCVAGCAALPVPAPAGPRTSVIGMRVWVEDATRHHSNPADGVHLVRLGQSGDPTRVTAVIDSSYAQGSTHYLFNAEPGRYALIGCWRQRDGRKVHTYFSASCIRESVVEVGGAALVFAGDFRIRTTTDTGKADDAQRHYFRLMDPELHNAGVLARMISRSGAQIATHHERNRRNAAASHFRSRAQKLLADTAWPSHFKVRGAVSRPARQAGP